MDEGRSPVPGSAPSCSPQYESLPGPGGCCIAVDSLPWACSTPGWKAGSAGWDELQPQHPPGGNSVAVSCNGGKRWRRRGGGGETAPWLLTHRCVLPGRRKKSSWWTFLHLNGYNQVRAFIWQKNMIRNAKIKTSQSYNDKKVSLFQSFFTHCKTSLTFQWIK